MGAGLGRWGLGEGRVAAPDCKVVYGRLHKAAGVPHWGVLELVSLKSGLIVLPQAVTVWELGALGFPALTPGSPLHTHASITQGLGSTKVSFQEEEELLVRLQELCGRWRGYREPVLQVQPHKGTSTKAVHPFFANADGLTVWCVVTKSISLSLHLS